MKKKGNLIYDSKRECMDIRFDLDDYYGGLHCGECLEVLLGNKWIPTRIEMNSDWYLVGVQTDKLVGLTVRI
ncbi:MAG: DUF5348 domain-containing protein [Eubacterium sp.]